MKSPYLRRKPPNTMSGTLCSLEPCLASCLKMLSRMPMSHLRERTAAWGRWAIMSARRWFLIDAPSFAAIPCKAALLTCQDSSYTTHVNASNSSTRCCPLLVLIRHGGAMRLQHVCFHAVGSCQLAGVVGLQCTGRGKCILAIAEICLSVIGFVFEVQASSSNRCSTSASHGPEMQVFATSYLPVRTKCQLMPSHGMEPEPSADYLLAMWPLGLLRGGIIG